VTEVNVRNVYTHVYVNKTVVNNVYVNQRVPGAMVAVRGDAMVGGRHIDANVAVRVPVGAMEHAEVMHAAPMAPERNAVLGGRAPVMGNHVPPPASMTRPVVAKAPPSPAPVPFVRQQEALKANPGRPLDAREVRGMQVNQPVVRPNIRPAAPVNAAPRPETVAPRNNPVLTPNPRRPDVRPEVPPPAVRPEDRRDLRPVTPVTPHPEVVHPETPRPEVTRPEPPRREVRPEVHTEPVRPEVHPAPPPHPEVHPAPPPHEEKQAPRNEQLKTVKPEKKTDKPEK